MTLGLMLLHRRDGTRVLVEAGRISTVAEIPGHGDTPPQCRVALRSPDHYEHLDVVETIDEILQRHSSLVVFACTTFGKDAV